MNKFPKEFDIPVNGHTVRAYSIGAGDNVLLLIHGGPGVPSNYLQDAHAVFAEYGYRVVTWDQLGCGKSDKIKNDDLLNLERFVQEVEVVRDFLKLGKVHLLGKSWGGILGIEYCLQYQENLKSLIITNSTPSVPRMEEGFNRLKAALGSETVSMMSKRETEGSTEHPEYKAAITLLLYRHICRMEHWPEALQSSCDTIINPVLNKIFGPQLFKCNGTLKNWDRVKDLHEIKVPTLIIHGEHDEIVPECATLMHKEIPHSKLAIFQNCSHMPLYENPSLYRKTLKNFLDIV